MAHGRAPLYQVLRPSSCDIITPDPFSSGAVHMKKLAIGCGVITLILLVGAGAGVWYLANKARGYLRDLQALAEVDKNIANTASFTPPASGELTPQMVSRFAAVQDGMRSRLGARVQEITATQDAFVRRMQAEGRKDATPAEAFTVVKDMMGLILQAKTAYIDALNDQRFSLEEYAWVRSHVYAAAGVSVTELSLQNLPNAVSGGSPVTHDLGRVSEEVPPKNKELVKPLLPRMKDWAPLAFFGL
jgi:hypothetical protein